MVNTEKILILAIETSCDETAASVISMQKAGKFPILQTLSSIVKSQIRLHAKMGGVVPEVAARAHILAIAPVVEKALSTSHCPLEAIDYVSVTQGPGLIPSLIVGVEFAKMLALAMHKPLIPVNHLSGHLYSPIGKIQDLGLQIKDVYPQIALIVSGGHTTLVLMKDPYHYKVLGQTVDDAAGEAFDKVAKLLKLPYPGGPEVSKLAEKGQPSIPFPRPMINSKEYNFSFAGLKTAVLYYLRDSSVRDGRDRPLQTINYKLKTSVCASFQQAVVDVLLAKAMRAAKEYKAKSISLSGGVSANRQLRESLRQTSDAAGLKFFVPEANLTTDNAEMIGIAAAFQLMGKKKLPKPAAVQADSNLSL